MFQRIEETDLDQVVIDLVKDYQKTIDKAWKKKSKAASDKAVKAIEDSPDTTTGYQEMLAVLSTELGIILTTKDIKRLNKAVTATYKINQTAEIAKIGAKATTPTVAAVATDAQVISGLASEGPYWIGNFYEDHLSRRIADLGFKTVVESGVPRKLAAEQMREVLKWEFALKGGSKFESIVPARFAGNVTNYSRIVSANVAQRSRVYSSVSAFRKAGIEQYRFAAVLDERTSEICIEMNGRIFTVEQGMQIVNAVGLAKTPDEFLAITAWPKNVEEVRAIAGTGTKVEQSENLAKAGIPLPPLHGFCRSTVESI